MPQKFNLRRLVLAMATFAAIALGSAVTSRADTIFIVGTNNSTQSTATLLCTVTAGTGGNSTLTFTLTNTSPGSSTITGIGFDLIPGDFLANNNTGGLNGFTGLQTSGSGTFDFKDTDLGNVPAGYSNSVLDFGFTTGTSGNFNGGTVALGLATGQSASFSVTGNFQGLTQSQICNSIFVRFQNTPVVGSDVGRATGAPGPVPEPTTMLLLGTGLIGVAGVARRRFKK